MSEPQYDTEDMAQIGIYDSLRTEIEWLRAELARLRGLPHMDRLSKDRAAVIEECARVVEDNCRDYDSMVEMAAAIRALKDRR